MRTNRIASLIAASALASATILGGAGIAGAQSTGSLGSAGSSAADERVTLDFTGLDRETASGTVETTGEPSDCTIYLSADPEDAATFSLILDGQETTDDLDVPSTSASADGTWEVEDERIDPEISFLALAECEIDGDPAHTIDAFGPSFGDIIGSSALFASLGS